jgi:hypothetical protein
VAHGQLEDAGAVLLSQFLHCSLISSLQPRDQLPILGPVRVNHLDLQNTDHSGLIPSFGLKPTKISKLGG